MAVASQPAKSRGQASRGRSKTKATAASRTGSANRRTKSTSAASTKRSPSASKSTRSATKSTASRASNSSTNGNGRSHSASNGHGDHGTLTNLGISVFSAVVGAAGGVLLTQRASRQHHRKVLGVPVPEKIDLGGIADQVGEAGRQFGQLAGEVKAVRETAAQIGRALS